MAEKTASTTLRNVKLDASEALGEIVDAIDFPAMGRKVEEFGKEKPVALALAALTVGLAAGFLMRKTAAGGLH